MPAESRPRTSRRSSALSAICTEVNASTAARLIVPATRSFTARAVRSRSRCNAHVASFNRDERAFVALELVTTEQGAVEPVLDARQLTGDVGGQPVDRPRTRSGRPSSVRTPVTPRSRTSGLAQRDRGSDENVSQGPWLVGGRQQAAHGRHQLEDRCRVGWRAPGPPPDDGDDAAHKRARLQEPRRQPFGHAGGLLFGRRLDHHPHERLGAAGPHDPLGHGRPVWPALLRSRSAAPRLVRPAEPCTRTLCSTCGSRVITPASAESGRPPCARPRRAAAHTRQQAIAGRREVAEDHVFPIARRRAPDLVRSSASST